MSTFFKTSLLLMGLSLTVTVQAATEVQSPFANDLRRFLKRNCYECHRGDDAEGGLDLSHLGNELKQKSNLKHWVRIFDRVQSGEMPPEDADQPEDFEKKAFLSATGSWIKSFEKHAYATKGRVQARRLTQLQLERSLHELLGIDMPLANKFPEESGQKFSTIAETQPMSHYHLERHLEVVDLALDKAFDRALKAENKFSHHLSAKQLARKNPKARNREPEMRQGLAAVWQSRLPFTGRMPVTSAKESGWIRVTVRASAIRPLEKHGGGIWCSLRSGLATSRASLMNWIGHFEVTKTPKEWTFETWLPEGHMLEIRPNDNTHKNGRWKGGQIDVGFGDKQQLQGIAMEWLKVERIYKGPSQKEVRKLLFGDVPIKEHVTERPVYKWKFDKETKKKKKILVRTDRKLTTEILSKPEDLNRLMIAFATRAYRRPVEAGDIKPYYELALAAMNQGQSFKEALRVGYRSLLCSPRFIYFYEKPGKLDDYAIASRLSYFLWQRPPDELLLQKAASGRLSDPKGTSSAA